jgi:hypothetical protein
MDIAGPAVLNETGFRNKKSIPIPEPRPMQIGIVIAVGMEELERNRILHENFSLMCRK